MTTSTWQIARQIAYYPTTSARGGKYHAAWLVSHTPVCGAAVLLDTSGAIYTRQGQINTQVHPIICRRCLRLSAREGVTAHGMKR